MEVGTLRLFVKLIVSVSPATAVIVGPGAHSAPHAPGLQNCHMGTLLLSGMATKARCAVIATLMLAALADAKPVATSTVAISKFSKVALYAGILMTKFLLY